MDSRLRGNDTKSEKPDEVSLFVNWFKYIFQDKKELVEEVQEIDGVKAMLKTSIKKYGKKIAQQAEREGFQKGQQKTAKALLKRKMPVKEISEITGLSVEEIKKLIE